MDKKEAVKFITQELGLNKSQANIVAELSGRLGAPPELVAKFVAQVASQNQAQAGFHPSPAPPPSSHAAASSPAPSPQAAPEVAQAFLQGSPEAAVSVASARRSVSPPEEDPELEKMIIDALGKSKRHSDVVMVVCEQTGMNWDQAQRTVARVETKNRKTLLSKQTRFVLPLAIAAIIFGIALLAAGLSEGYKAAAQVQDFTTGDGYYVPNLEYVINEGLVTLSTGGTLFLGGVAGLIIALKKLFE